MRAGLALALLALSAVGCTGGDDATPATSTAPVQRPTTTEAEPTTTSTTATTTSSTTPGLVLGSADDGPCVLDPARIGPALGAPLNTLANGGEDKLCPFYAYDGEPAYETMVPGAVPGVVESIDVTMTDVHDLATQREALEPSPDSASLALIDVSERPGWGAGAFVMVRASKTNDRKLVDGCFEHVSWKAVCISLRGPDAARLTAVLDTLVDTLVGTLDHAR